MASDAFMEVADPNVWGEAQDEEFGMEERRLGAFEISSFTFTATSKDKDDKAAKQPGKPAATANAATPANKQKQAERPTFSIEKAVDAGSSDLFLACCKKNKIQWGIVTFREAGDASKNPWLTLTFSDMQVETFTWELDPDAKEEAALGQEKITFSFGAIEIKYAPQTAAGQHDPPSIKGFNFADTGADAPGADA